MCNFGKCDFLKENVGKDISWEFDNCPRMLSNSDMSILLDCLSGKIIEFGENLENFILSAQGEVDLYNYFYMYYRKLDCYLHWADVHLGDLVDKLNAS